MTLAHRYLHAENSSAFHNTSTWNRSREEEISTHLQRAEQEYEKRLKSRTGLAPVEGSCVWVVVNLCKRKCCTPYVSANSTPRFFLHGYFSEPQVTIGLYYFTLGIVCLVT